MECYLSDKLIKHRSNSFMQFKFCQNKKVMDNHLALMQLSGTSDHLLKQRKEQMVMEIFSKVEAICIVDKVSGKTIKFTLL